MQVVTWNLSWILCDGIAKQSEDNVKERPGVRGGPDNKLYQSF